MFFLIVGQAYVVCHKNPKVWIQNSIPFFLCIRLYQPLMGTDGKIQHYKDLSVLTQFNALVYIMYIAQMLINLTYSIKVSAFLTFTTGIVTIYGQLFITKGDLSIKEAAKSQLGILILTYIIYLAIMFGTTFILYLQKKDLLHAIDQSVKMCSRTQNVLENLEVGIICQSNKGINFCNNLGFRMLNEVNGILQHQEESLSERTHGGTSHTRKRLTQRLLDNHFLLNDTMKKKQEQK